MESPDKLNVAFIEQDTYGSFCSDLEDSLSEHSAIGPVLDGHGLRCSTPIREVNVDDMEFTREFDLTYVIKEEDSTAIDAVADELANIQIADKASDAK